MDKETPITKYLATLEKRQALLYGSSHSSPSSPVNTGNIKMKLSFDDDTFLLGHGHSYKKHDMSLLHISPQNQVKRTRYSIYDDDDNEGLQKKSSELERLLRETQADLIESRALVAKLEHQIMEIKKQHMEKIIWFEKSNSEIKSKSKNSIDHAERLEHQLKRAEKAEVDLQSKLRQQSEAYNVKFRVMEDKITQLQCENVELKKQMNNDNIRTGERIQKLTNDLEETARGAEKWVMESQLLKEQLERKDEQLKLYQTEQLAIKLKEIQTLVSNKEEKEKNTPESQTQIAALEERVKKYENLFCKQQNDNHLLVKEMNKLKEENSVLSSIMRSEMVLKEQISSLESQLNSSRNELTRRSAIESDNSILNDELNKWKSIGSKIDVGCKTPAEFEAFVRGIQNMLIQLKHENSELQYKNDNDSRLVSKLQAESVSLRDQIKISKEEKEKLTIDMKKLTRRMGLIAKDRDGLKGLKDSYEQEFTGLISSPLQERISQLESVVSEYETILKEEANVKKNCGECENRMSLVNQLRAELENKKRELSEIQSSNMPGALQQQPMSCDDNTEGFKIVAFSMNPSALTMEGRVKELLSENDRLKERLKDFEDQTSSGFVDPAIREEKKKLEDQLKVLERKHQLLTEAYEYETHMLNSAISRLFGFHITLIQEPTRQIHLQSIYSQSTNTEDAFIFQEAENQDMMLLETPILNSFRDDIDRFLIGMNSIPAFVACITITYVQSSGQPSYDDMSLIPMSQDSQPPSQPSASGGIVNVRVQNVNVADDDDDDDDDDEDDEHVEEEEMYDDDEPEDYDDHQDDDDDDDVVTIDDD